MSLPHARRRLECAILDGLSQPLPVAALDQHPTLVVGTPATVPLTAFPTTRQPVCTHHLPHSGTTLFSSSGRKYHQPDTVAMHTVLYTTL